MITMKCGWMLGLALLMGWAVPAHGQSEEDSTKVEDLRNQPTWSPRLWYHIAITWGAGTPTVFYLNGMRIHEVGADTATLSFSSSETPIDRIVIGCDPSAKRQANALLDEVLIFDALLTAEQISRLVE